MLQGSGGSLRDAIRDETAHIHPQLRWMYFRNALLSRSSAVARRAQLLRSVGFTVDEGVQIHGMPRITGSPAKVNPDGRSALFHHLHIGRDSVLDTGLVFDLEERITIGCNVRIGPQVMILTSSHEIGPKEHRAGKTTRSPVVISDGAWIGARCVILPGVTIGAGAVVDAGSVVNKDVPPNVRFGGIPAKKLEVFSETE